MSLVDCSPWRVLRRTCDPIDPYAPTQRGTGNVNNQQAFTDTVSRNVYAGGYGQHVVPNTTKVASGEYGALAFIGVATLATAGVVWVECISTMSPGASTAVRLNATSEYSRRDSQ